MHRCLTSNLPSTTKIYKWLKALYGFRGRQATKDENDEIRIWLTANKTIALDMFLIAIDEFNLNQSHRFFLREFMRLTMFSVLSEDLAQHIYKILKSSEFLLEKDYYLYQVWGELILHYDPFLSHFFNDFFYLANKSDKLKSIRKNLCKSDIPEWNWDRTVRPLGSTKLLEKDREQNRENLKKTKDSVRSGNHLRNLGWFSALYFGLVMDRESNLSPIDRLKAEIGSELIEIVIDGFVAVTQRNDLPSPRDIALVKANNKGYRWWFACLAGIDISWQRTPDLSNFSDNLLESALSIAIEYPTTERIGNVLRETQRPWKEQLFKERPHLVQKVFDILIKTQLRAKADYIGTIEKLAHSKETEPWRSSLAVKLLSDFPTASPEMLYSLLQAATYDRYYLTEVIDLAKNIIEARGRVRLKQRAVWLAVGFLLANNEFLARFKKYANTHEWIFWIVIKVFNLGIAGRAKELKIETTEALVKIVGEKFENVSNPDGDSDGDHNPWDAAQFVRNQINSLSAIPKFEASDLLIRFRDNNKLKSYQDIIKHAIANQAALLRELEYVQPDWVKTIATLRGREPANISDLHALILYFLKDMKTEINLSNTDQYKSFWKCDSHARVDTPEVEDICRDRLLDLLRYRLLPLNLRAEPEGHMVTDKRADIVILPPPGAKLPLELKRDTNEDLWTACEDQLERLYTRDPEAEGYGIYIVFWFGEKRMGSVPKPPSGFARPTSAEELESVLNKIIPSDKRHCLEAVVLDVSPPAQPNRRKKGN